MLIIRLNTAAVFRRGISCALLQMIFFIPSVAAQGWSITTHHDQEMETDIKVAYSRNSAGYTLEIYRDSVDAIRSRITLADGLLEFTDNSCPTFQIDRGTASNHSINDAPCLSDKVWAEFILGYVDNGSISSSVLLALMNGIAITYRFRLTNGDYRETKFSLQGSKRALNAAFGQDIHVILSSQ